MLHAARNYLARIAKSDRSRFTCMVDFAYHHYALGDALTTQVIAACLAEESGCSGVDLVLLLNPERPAAPTQSFITEGNYPLHLENLLPAFLCLPQLLRLRIVRDRVTPGYVVCSLAASRAPRWPPLRDHLRQHIEWPLDHDIIDRFYKRHGRIPQLGAPKGYGEWAREFLARHAAGKYIVAVNPRQSRFSPIPATTYRDSPLDEWHRFIDMAGSRYPEVHFLMLGGFHEWDRTLLRRSNVTVPRTMGLSLAHELALLVHANLFLGTSSGFATMATFTKVPYLISNVEPFFAAFVQVDADASRYPFASKNQTLSWRREDAELLMAHFESEYRGQRDTPDGGDR